MKVVVVAWGPWPDGVDDDTTLSWLGGDSRTLAGERVEWDEYLDSFTDNTRPYLEAVRAEVVARGCRGDGRWHQEEGVPVFSDGKVLALSLRAWGDLMAAIWTTEDDAQYSYMDFYYS